MICPHIGVEPKIGGKLQNGWFIMVPTVLKWDDLGVPLFLETPIWVQFVVYVGHIADS